MVICKKIINNFKFTKFKKLTIKNVAGLSTIHTELFPRQHFYFFLTDKLIGDWFKNIYDFISSRVDNIYLNHLKKI